MRVYSLLNVNNVLQISPFVPRAFLLRRRYSGVFFFYSFSNNNATTRPLLSVCLSTFDAKRIAAAIVLFWGRLLNGFANRPLLPCMCVCVYR